MATPKKKDQKSNSAGSTKAPKPSKCDQVDAHISMIENLAMINLRRFGLKGHDRTPYIDQLKEKKQNDLNSTADDQKSQD